MKDPDIPYALLAKYFAGQCTPSERSEVEQWRDTNEKQKELFLRSEAQWRSVQRDPAEDVLPDKEILWQKIRTEHYKRHSPLPSYSRAYLLRVAGMAAAVALVMGLSISALFRMMAPQPAGALSGVPSRYTLMAPSGQKSQLLLPDGTTVWLNSGSTLVYSSQYNAQERTVELAGEGYFEVKPNPGLPFIVKTGTIDVQVHGTDFNVEAYAEEETITVSLVRGHVSLLHAPDQSLITHLEPEQSAVVSKADLNYRIAGCDPQTEASWHQNELRFEFAGAEEIWKKLERWYGVKVILLNESPDRLYRFSVKTESLTELLELIDKITPIEYQLNGEEVTIQYK